MGRHISKTQHIHAAIRHRIAQEPRRLSLSVPRQWLERLIRESEGRICPACGLPLPVAVLQDLTIR